MTEYIDLGLPSGKLWCIDNEEGYFTFDEAVEKFQDQLPTIEDWRELFAECEKKRTYDELYGNGIEFKAKNGNRLFIPFAGRCINYTYDLQGDGYYWTDKNSLTGTPRCVRFHDTDSIDVRVLTEGRISVRLIKSE